LSPVGLLLSGRLIQPSELDEAEYRRREAANDEAAKFFLPNAGAQF
jgi:hypothetical protein